MVAKRLDGSSLMRTTAHFKKVQFKTVEDAQKWLSSEWPMEPVSEALQNTKALVQSRLTELQQRWQPVSPSPQTLYRWQVA